MTAILTLPHDMNARWLTLEEAKYMVVGILCMRTSSLDHTLIPLILYVSKSAMASILMK